MTSSFSGSQRVSHIQHNKVGDGEREAKKREEAEGTCNLQCNAQQYRQQTCQDGTDAVSVSGVCNDVILFDDVI